MQMMRRWYSGSKGWGDGNSSALDLNINTQPADVDSSFTVTMYDLAITIVKSTEDTMYNIYMHHDKLNIKTYMQYDQSTCIITDYSSFKG